MADTFEVAEVTDASGMSAEEASRPARGRGLVLLGLLLSMGLAAMDSTIVATAIPAIVRELGGFSLFAWVFSIYVLAQAVTIPIYGKLADLHGRKPVLIAGTALFLLGSVLSGLSWSMVTLIVFRGIQGLGAGAIQPVVMTVAGDLYTVKERARIQGWFSSIWGVSAIIGPAIGGFIVEYTSWRWIFYINVPLGILALAAIGRFLRERVAHQRHRIDYAGAALLALGVGLLILGLLEGGVGWDWLSTQSEVVFGAALLAMLAFVVRERFAAEPAVPLWVFGRRLLLGANLSSAALGALNIGLTTFLPTYAQGVLRVDAVVAGFILAAMSIGWPVAATLSGRLYLRIGFRDAALLGAVVCLGASLLFVALPADAAPWMVALGSLVMGAGLGLLSTPVVVGIQSIIGWKGRGVVTSANLFTRQMGQAVGAAVFGSMVNLALANWLANAPATLAGQLPTSVNAVTQLLGNGPDSLSPDAAAYLRAGLYLATQQVFWGLLLVAIFVVLVLLLTPRRFERHRLDERGRRIREQPQTEQIPA
jgi:EmrB/QacA subfamily drug resistance transporter